MRAIRRAYGCGWYFVGPTLSIDVLGFRLITQKNKQQPGPDGKHWTQEPMSLGRRALYGG